MENAKQTHSGRLAGIETQRHAAAAAAPVWSYLDSTKMQTSSASRGSKKLRFVVSLTIDDNDYQTEQAVAAENAARQLGLEAQVVYAENDSVKQSQQLLTAIQSRPDARPDGIIFEPVGGTALPQVARVAVSAGIGWVVLNREASYLPDLRKASSAPAFAISSDHIEVGRIQGRQIAALLPKGGRVLYIQGPSDNSAARERAEGFMQTKPANVQMQILKGKWTEESSTRAVQSWLSLMISRNVRIDLVAAQDDSMAIGARRAFDQINDAAERSKWLALPYVGCDGLPKTGQEWVRRGFLRATVYIPPNTPLAIEMLSKALTAGLRPPERTLTTPKSIPPLEELASQRTRQRSVLLET
jgi:ABC-type sugar transport system substrate-binding protein